MTDATTSNSRREAPHVNVISYQAGWQRLMVREFNGATLFDGLVPDADMAQEVSVIVGRYWRLVLEEDLSKAPEASA